MRLLYNAWTVISGCVFIVSGYVVYHCYGHEHKGLCMTIWVLSSLYGFGCEIISGFFPVDENAAKKTASHIIHGIGSVIGFTALLFVPLLLGIVQLRSNEAVVGSVSVTAFILSVVFFVIFVMSDKPTFRNTVLSWTGLWQRASMYAMYLPLIVFTIYLL